MRKSLFLLFGISLLLSACGIKDEAISDTINAVAESIQTEIENEVEKEVNQFVDNIAADVLDDFTVEDTNPQLNNNLQEAKVVRVVDGDTLVAIVNGEEEKIRLIGVDTPESVHSNKEKNNEYGTMASDYTKSIIPEVIYLEYDEDPADQYDRLLCYVWLCNDTSNMDNMLNARLLKDGYAFNKEYKPNVKYAENFEEICNTAEINNSGLWQYEEFHELWY